MRPSIILSLVASVAASSNYTFPPSFNINQVDADKKDAWCTAQRHTCPKICDGYASINTCNSQTLQFTCECGDGNPANVAPYMQTVPYFVCIENYGQCIQSHGKLSEQEKCKEQRKENCGTLNATEDSGSSSSSSSASSAAGASSTAASLTSATGANEESTATSSSSGAAATTTNAAVLLAQDYSTGLLATVLFLAARFAL